MCYILLSFLLADPATTSISGFSQRLCIFIRRLKARSSFPNGYKGISISVPVESLGGQPRFFFVRQRFIVDFLPLLPLPVNRQSPPALLTCSRREALLPPHHQLFFFFPLSVLRLRIRCCTTHSGGLNAFADRFWQYSGPHFSFRLRADG